ncbi:MAG: hypothetical protein FJZ56_01920 [Chlamydiae bacterium]|nr:hypothetical protein [Chlamydiota bacterium]
MNNVNNHSQASSELTLETYNPKSDPNISQTIRNTANKLNHLQKDALENISLNLMKLARMKESHEKTSIVECSQITELMSYADEKIRNESNSKVKSRLEGIANIFEPSSLELSISSDKTSLPADSIDEEEELYEDDFEPIESDDEEVEAMSLYGSDTLKNEASLPSLPSISTNKKSNSSTSSTKSSNPQLPAIHDKYSPKAIKGKPNTLESVKLPKLF